MKKNKLPVPLLIALLILVLLFGIGCIIYPIFASWYNEQHKAQVLTEYQEVLENTDNEKRNAALQAAMEYNDQLFHGQINTADPIGNGYYDLVNLAGNGIMGYISIPTIDVYLPIYHSAEEPYISKGAGHLVETSLPVGGENTHAVLSAHSGMASNALFSELERLKVGDYFYIEILGQTLTYQIQSKDDIIAVLPTQTEYLVIEEGEDLVTLLTCTPYGVNTHRLLVTGTRVEDPEEAVTVADAESTSSLTSTLSVRTLNYIKGISIGLFCSVFLILLIAILVLIAKRKKNTEEPNTIFGDNVFQSKPLISQK